MRNVPQADRRAEHSLETQRRLVAVARGLFAERGFAATPTEELVSSARLTRGALYHHYIDKRALFRAAFEAVEEDLARRVALAAAAETDPWEQMRAGTRAYLEACRDPAIRRVVLVDGPSVLGWEEWRQIDSRYSFGMVKAALEANIAAGNLPRQDVEPLTHLYVGALNEAGMAIAVAQDPAAATEAFMATMDRVMDGQRVGRGRRKRPRS